MNRRLSVRPVMATLCVALAIVTASVGVNCPPGDGTSPFNPPVAPGDRAPRIMITRVDTPTGGTSVEEGDMVTIAFFADSGDIDETATVSIFASTSPNPGLGDPTTIPIPIRGGNNVFGPGTGTGEGMWDTTGVAAGSYNLFAEIDDGVNPLVRVTSLSPIGVAPMGTQPATTPPELVFLDPVANLGLSSDDELTIRYIYSDTDSDVTVTLLLDKDLDPANDDVAFPGNPLDPDIIVLPSTPRLISDPTFDGDPPPPDDPANPPNQPDSVQIRTNPRTLPMTSEAVFPFPGAPMPGELKEYRFVIDFTKIPPRTQPVFLRADITDGQNTVSRYAVGSLTISRLAEGTVDVEALGFSLAGARFQGFSAGENLGTDFVNVTDLDGDGQQDFMLASRFGSPRNRFQSGVSYLIFGRRKTPFPADTDMDGLPDGGVQDDNGDIVNFPAPPDFDGNGISEFPDPYLPQNVGRFGGVLNINSINSFFRGALYPMPQANFSNLLGSEPPPGDLFDPDHPDAFTAGLTSVTRFDMNADGVQDFVFGVPYISFAREFQDDDPADGCAENANPYLDFLPNEARCDADPPVDSIGFIREGMVIMVDGATDLRFEFSKFVDAGIAGQLGGAQDDEGVLHGPDTTPNGVRLRGAWFRDIDELDPATFGIDPTNEYGRTVSVLPNFDNPPADPNLSGEELMVSSPGFDALTQFSALNPRMDVGRITVWLNADYTDQEPANDANESIPNYSSTCPTPGVCTTDDPPTCRRCFVPTPQRVDIVGAQDGDRFGFGVSAGQFNQDGTPDILAGSPGADRNGLTDNGVTYVLFTPQGGFGNTETVELLPRLELVGTHDDDRFGMVNSEVEDLNGDGISDVAIAAESFDADVDGNPGEEADVGYVGVIFGNRPLTGENGFTPDQVGTPALFGVRFLGATAGALAGRDVTSAGDFNKDGFGDLLITSPGEVRMVNGQPRKGVAYLIFGGTHLFDPNDPNANAVYNLSQVGSPSLPGMVFISRFVVGTPDEAPLEYVGGIGDIDGDGFDDIMISAPTADFVNTASPNQRRNDAGEVYLVYGNNFGANNCTTFPNPCTP